MTDSPHAAPGAGTVAPETVVPGNDALITAPIPLPAVPVQQLPVMQVQQFPAADVKAIQPRQDRRIPLAMLVVGVLLLGAAVLSYRHGIATNLFPAYLADGAPTPIRRYSAPWIIGAAGLVLAAGLLIVQGSARLVHYKL